MTPEEKMDYVREVPRSIVEARIEEGLQVAIDCYHASSVQAGWYHNPVTGEPIDRNVPEMLALIHSEVSEALEGVRKDLMDDKLPHRKAVECELADLLIRTFDLAGYLKKLYPEIDVAESVIEKSRYNSVREDHKIENRAKEGGKKF
jgi:NTP pyrophosphatase (non-canonical NTP hydrolase)